MVSTHLITATELETLGSDARFELIQGVLHEMSPSSSNSSAVGLRLAIELGAYIYRHDLGIATGADGGFRVESNPDSVAQPDIGFIRKERMHLWPGQKGLFPGVPDLAIEIISPTDERGDIQRKMALYERTRVPLVWWIDPIRRATVIQRADQPVQHLASTASLDGESVVPGFSIPLSLLFEFIPNN